MKKVHLSTYIGSFLVTFIGLMGLFAMLEIAPFGTRSLASMDANAQYLDFFCYFKDVLAGENSVLYSFSKMLGGNNIGGFSYYLASPFNWLVVFFNKAQMHSFFNLAVALKLSTAAVTFAVFLRHRFADRITRVAHGDSITVLLAVSYALCQYCIAQSANIMWLDGVYMLPLILLGVYYVTRQKHPAFLSVCVGLNILFNWYIAGVNCLFSFVWLCFELLLRRTEESAPFDRCFWKRVGGSAARYGALMVLGVMLSAVLFFPTVAALGNSEKGALELNVFTNLAFLGNLLTVIPGFALGARSDFGVAALFCGSAALIGCILCFCIKELGRRRLVLGGLLALAVLLLYWIPFFELFSLFKDADSFWFRYSYVTIFTILFIAAYGGYYADIRRYGKRIAYIAAVVAVVLVAGCRLMRRNRAYLPLSVALLLGIALLLIFCLYAERRWLKRAATVLLCVCVAGELALNAVFLMQGYTVSDVAGYRAYVTKTDEQIAAIKAADPAFYRISQTKTRNTGPVSRLRSNYNEAYAYNYAGIAGYTSTPDGVQLDLLARCGYPTYSGTVSVVNTSILAADSLLGMKYVLADEPLKGLQPTALGDGNGKRIYKNPYALPMAFVYTPHADACPTGANPFTYQNALYSALLGREVTLYQEVAFTRRTTDKSAEYTLTVPAGNVAVYASLPWEETCRARLDVNGRYTTNYACWLSPTVVYVPYSGERAYLRLTAPVASTLLYGQEQIYALDLDLLAAVSEELSRRPAQAMTVKNGYVSITATAEENQRLFTSIPYDAGWTVKVNGKKVQPALFADCLYSIPLTAGENVIEMRYSVPGLTAGALVSLLAVGLVIALTVADNRRKRKSIG